VLAEPRLIRFGAFQLDVEAGQLLKNGRIVRLKPQPFKLLHLLASRAGDVVTREEIRQELWGADTFVDFEQGVNTAVKQIRDALKEDADRPLYLETVPKRGYRFIAPVDSGTDEDAAATPLPPQAPAAAVVFPRTDLNLQKALWLNIAELRLAEARRRQRRRVMLITLAVLAVLGALGAAIVYLS
jgi:DNA-binding winged helix-turn-helix (wHTH) protein